MKPIEEHEIREYIERNIPSFHERRLQSLGGLSLKSVLKRKNPYLFKAKNIKTAGDLVKTILDAHLSSQEETIFGEFLEGLAIFICGHVYGGRKSSADGIDLEFEKSGVYYIVTIKSGPNWGNSRQINKMLEDFRKAKRILRTNASGRDIRAVNGCSYGRHTRPQYEDKGDYLKLCGQSFWSFISGMDTLYTDIIEPIGHRAKERNDAFNEQYAKVVNVFTKEFIEEFCQPDGTILWEKIVRFNSSVTGEY
ncbi:MAG: PmeII family type II restriction endonuclease [Planctomycetota bacterium]